MYVTYGTRVFGKCDNVPELFYVATWCFHINYVPLVPSGTRLVLGQSGNQYQVIHLPFSFKSLFLAWVRAGGFAGGVVAFIFAFVALSDGQDGRDFGVVTPLLIGLACTAALLLAMIPKWRKPSYKRACELAQIANLNERAWAALNVQYGRDPMDRPNKVEVLSLR